MRREAVVVVTEDAEVIASLVRIGCAATAASPIPATAAVEQMRRNRMLKIGSAFLDELDPHQDTPLTLFEESA